MCQLAHTHLRNKANSIFLPISFDLAWPYCFMHTLAWSVSCSSDVPLWERSPAQRSAPCSTSSCNFWNVPFIPALLNYILSQRLSSVSPPHPSGTEAHLVPSLAPHRGPRPFLPLPPEIIFASLRFMPPSYTRLSLYNCCYPMKSESKDLLRSVG